MTDLKLVLEYDYFPHVMAEIGRGEVATLKTIPNDGLVGPLVEEIHEASLTASVALGGTS